MSAIAATPEEVESVRADLLPDVVLVVAIW